MKALCVLLAASVGTIASLPVRAQPAAAQADALERRVKAVFVFKFASFVDWPAEQLEHPDAPIQIAVMGEEAVVRDIADAAGSRTVEGRRVLARRVEPGDLLDGVHILFLRDSAFARLAEGLPPQPMLVVTETPGALARGSVVNFVVDDGRVRFDISLESAERRGLKLSSRLITVARNVIGR